MMLSHGVPFRYGHVARHSAERRHTCLTRLHTTPPRFGGTCVGSSERIRNAAKLMIELPCAHKCVVVSAMGTPGKGIPKARAQCCQEDESSADASALCLPGSRRGAVPCHAGLTRPTPWLQVTDMLLNMIAKAEAHDEAYKTEACRLSAVFSAHIPAL